MALRLARLAGALSLDKGLQRCCWSSGSSDIRLFLPLMAGELTCPHKAHHLIPVQKKSPRCAPFCPLSGKELEGLQGSNQTRKTGNKSLRDIRSHSKY